MLSRARPIYRNIGKGGICHSWQKHSKATKEEDIVFQHSVLQQKGTQHVCKVESHIIYIPSKILSQPNFLCAVTNMLNLEITNEHVLEHTLPRFMRSTKI